MIIKYSVDFGQDVQKIFLDIKHDAFKVQAASRQKISLVFDKHTVGKIFVEK